MSRIRDGFWTGLGVSSLGDAMRAVTVAWLAVLIAPGDSLGVLVGLAVAAYTLAGVIGALVLSPVLRSGSSARCPLAATVSRLAAVVRMGG